MFRVLFKLVAQLFQIWESDIAIKTDQEGHETSWELRRSVESEPRYSGPEDGTNYLSSTTYSGAVCLGIGMYEFTIQGMSL